MTALPQGSSSATEAQAALERVRAARAQHRAGGGAGAVLDLLRGSTGGVAADVAMQWCALAGVAVLPDPAGTRPDFSRWDLERARAARAAVVVDGSGRQWLAAEDPWDEGLVTKVSVCLGAAPALAAVDRGTLQTWLAAGLVGGVTPQRMQTAAPIGEPTVPPTDGPIVRFVDRALHAGYGSGASDVHFECDRHGVTVKHRLDGVMTLFDRMEGSTPAQEVISRIKVLAQLDITERRLPQDGRFRMDVGHGSVDLRVSIMPSVHGEDAVLRLLDKSQLRSRDAAVSLDALGFASADADRLRALAMAPSGMLLITGPTGSGKTTTVYAALSEINTGLEKIITIEDPVEYELPGVLQIPVNERKGLTFAKGLRSILRHDPDRILVGEIRDAETAEIAVQSALTGHLVFTTVHANSMTDVVGRFRHFGIDMFGFMSSLNGLVVQRLIRRLCTDCRSIRRVTPRDLPADGMTLETVRVAVGCAACHGSGYRGRFVLAEIHRVDDEFRDNVTEGAPLSVLKERARRSGVTSLMALAMDAVASGETTLEEVRRVVGWV